mmetsp:Transcript_13948/g.46069  ORF Transcript_13948/g.46069 Transcript_13948/m.46069 type:complete len:285 (+) Transcript_13948:403-1257(+)
MASGFLQQRESARSARSEDARSSTLLYTILRITLPHPSPGTLGPGLLPPVCRTSIDVTPDLSRCHLKNIEHTLSTPAAPAAPRASPGKISKGESPGLPKPGRGAAPPDWLSRRRGRESFSGRGPSGGGGCAEARDVEREVTHCLWRQVDLEAHRAHFRLHRPRHRALGLAGVAPEAGPEGGGQLAVRVVDGEVEARVGGGVAERAREDVEEDILAAPRVLRKVKQREVRLGERRSEGEDIRVVGAKVDLRAERAPPHAVRRPAHVARPLPPRRRLGKQLALALQ